MEKRIPGGPMPFASFPDDESYTTFADPFNMDLNNGKGVVLLDTYFESAANLTAVEFIGQDAGDFTVDVINHLISSN